ncbi:MAG: hypothetical protein OXC10_05565 [Rhodospirillaceae bacterium]|nr:hypothetical protein [Rhodospirillaceae bacterium]
MTDEVELRKAVHRVREEASAARSFFHTWNALNLAQGETPLRATMNDYRYVDFFITSMEGNFRLFFLSLRKIFDRDKYNDRDTIGLPFLAKKLEDAGHCDLARAISEITSGNSCLIEKIRRVTNKSIAHSDLASTSEIFESASITPNQVEALIDASCGLLNTIGERMGLPNRISEGERDDRAVRHLLKTLHDSRLPRTKRLGWDQVRQFFADHGCVVAGHPESRWYREAWEAFDKAGLTNTTKFEDFEFAQTVLKLRALCLLTMYLGMYQAAGPHSNFGGYFSEHPDISWYLDSLDVQMKDIWELARTSGMLEPSASTCCEDEEADDEQLREIAMDLVSEENTLIFDALIEHYDGNVELFLSLWNSRMSPDDAEPFETVVESMRPQDGTAEVWAYVEEGMKRWSWT